jgi:hypothetical protein
MEWRIPYEASIAAWYAGHPEKGRSALHMLLGRDDIPEPFQSSVQANKEFYFA